MSDRAKSIPDLDPLTAPVGGDFLIIEDVSANTTKRVTVTDLSLNFPFNGNAQYTYNNTVVFNGLTRCTLPIFQGNTTANATFGIFSHFFAISSPLSTLNAQS